MSWRFAHFITSVDELEHLDEDEKKNFLGCMPGKEVPGGGFFFWFMVLTAAGAVRIGRNGKP